MKKRRAGVLLLLVLFLGACRGLGVSAEPVTLAPSPGDPLFGAPACIPRHTDRERARVVDVVDGDTIVVDLGGRPYRVRYIGMDTPEKDEPLFEEARRRNRTLVLDREVLLVQDVSETDRYGRLLRYVLWFDRGKPVFVNEVLVREGLARAATYPPDVACASRFLQAQREARQAGRGLWARERLPVATPTVCDPAYPDLCLPPPPPDLDCSDIQPRGFRVLPPDPHGLDADGDGVGCEGK